MSPGQLDSGALSLLPRPLGSAGDSGENPERSKAERSEQPLAPQARPRTSSAFFYFFEAKCEQRLFSRNPGCHRSRQRCHPAVTSPRGRGSRAEPGRVTVPGPGTRLMHHCPRCHRSHGDKWGRGSASAPESLPLRTLQEETGPRQVSRRQISPGVTAELLLAGTCPIP